MRTGYLGGTFDPPHLGHMCLAQEALERFSLESVLFVPAGHPPHKEAENLSSWNDRLEMIRLAVAGNPRFQAAALEPPGEVSYTVDLLERVAFSKGRPFFIMGMDSLEDFRGWREPERILELAEVLVGTRPGCDLSSVPGHVLSRVRLFDFPGVWISSSDIRRRAAEGRSISYLVPGSVESYIRSRGLYGAKKGN